MRRAPQALVRRSALFILLYVLIVASWHAAVGSFELASRLTVSILGGVLGAVLGGLWLGARVGESLRAWRACRPTMPDVALPTRWRATGHDAVPLFVAWASGLAAALVWSLWAKPTPLQVALAYGVLAATLIASAGVAAWIEWFVHSRGMVVAYGVAFWLVPLSAVVWAPEVVAHSRSSLEGAVLVNPGGGVLAALGVRNVFWAPALYGRLPYADYGVRLAGPVAHMVGWGALGATLLGARALAAGLSWGKAR
ncbi:hypothetical protein CMK11_22010 [Candidatus Poribacteria bacterium]|nr:hypothetical protein [Candidatus Poribacteria bacterium]